MPTAFAAPEFMTHYLALRAAGFNLTALKTWTAREGVGYQFNLTRNGTKVAVVTQNGQGGPTDIEWLGLRYDGSAMLAPANETKKAVATREAQVTASQAARDALAKIAAAQPAAIFHGRELPVSEEDLMASLADAHDVMKRCKKNTLFLPGDKGDEGYRIINMPYDARIKTALASKYPSVFIFNEALAPYLVNRR